MCIDISTGITGEKRQSESSCKTTDYFSDADLS